MDGYAGRILNLNLSDGSGRDFVVPEDIVHRYIGGKGIGVWLLYNGLDPHIDPLGPENVLLLMTGPLTGVGIPAVNHLAVVTKSPLTGTVADSYLGGDFAVKLKSCGYDGLILRGSSPRPVIVDITEGRWRIRDAGDIWGANVAWTQELLQSKAASTLCIGPAGENLVRYATIASGEHTTQRGGAGAVLGSKLVKAIRVGGGFETSVFDRERLKAPVEAIKARLKNPGSFSGFGTAENLAASNAMGVLPTRNFVFGKFDNYLKISGDALRASIKRKAHGCPVCPLPCTMEIKIAAKSGTVRVKGPGYQALAMLGSNLCIDDLETIVRNNFLCYLLGMDPVSTGGTIATAMDLSEKGRLDLPLRFGSAREVGPLLPLIAERKGPGDELADGAVSLVLKYGYGDLAMAVKGLELPGYDPRGCWGQGLCYATCPAGGSHVGSMLAAPEVQQRPVGVPGAKAAGKPRLAVFSQNLCGALGCLAACFKAAYALVKVPDFADDLPGFVTGTVALRAPGPATALVDFSPYYRALSFVTGIKYTRGAFLRTGERVFNLERLFNLREGYTSKDDNIPLRFIGEPMKEGPSAGKVVPITRMLLKYYRLRRWNEVGIPTGRLLSSLGIEEYREI